MPDRPVAPPAGTAGHPWRGPRWPVLRGPHWRRWRFSRWLWIPVIPIVLVIGLGALGLSYDGLRLGFTSRSVDLRPPIPATIRTAELSLSGQTRPSAFITVFVDGSRLPQAIAGDDGRFQLTIDVGGEGLHHIRLEVAYGAPDQPDEVLEADVTRVPDALPTPELIAVQQLTDPKSFALLVSSTPLTEIDVTGPSDDPSPVSVDGTGRVRFELHLAEAGGPVTLTARDSIGRTSPPTDALDLAALAANPDPVAMRERGEWTVSYEITRDGVIRTQSVAIDPGRREVSYLTRGAISAETFVRGAGGEAGLAPAGNQGCIINNVRPAQSELEIADRAIVTLTDEFPDLLTSWNGLTDRPQISLCFPQGFPGLGNSGTVELKVRGYSVAAVTEAVTGASHETLESREVERTYTWTSVPHQGAIVVSLTLDAPSVLAALPTVRVRTVIDDEGLGLILLAVIDALIHGAGILLLIWATISRVGRSRLPESPRRALADILTLGAAVQFLPAFGESQVVGLWLANLVPPILAVAGEIEASPSLVGRWAAAGVVLLAAGGLAWRYRSSHEFRGRLSLAIAGGAAGWLGISILGWLGARFVIDLAPQGGAELGLRVVTWLVGALGLTIVIAVAVVRLGALLGRRNQVSIGRGWAAQLGWSALAALLLALPAGTDQTLPAGPENAASYVAATVTGLAGLVAFVYPLVAIAAVALMVRAAWGSVPWEATLGLAGGDDPRSIVTGSIRGAATAHLGWLGPRLGRALFAGFVIGTAGILLPVPFILAFGLFGIVLLRPAREIVALEAKAADLRRDRKHIIKAALGDAPSKERLELLGVDSPPGPAELGPESSVWGNVRLALRAALVLELLLVTVYVFGYSFASMTRQDEFFLQRLLLNVLTFAGTWLTIALVFALLYEYLRGTTGVRKGLWFGFAILLLTVPWQLLSGLTTTISPIGIGIHVFEVISFTGLIGAAFDVRLMQHASRVVFSRPRQLLRNVGVVSGLPDLAAALGLILTAAVTTILSVATGQVTQLLTRVLSPFLPLSGTGT